MCLKGPSAPPDLCLRDSADVPEDEPLGFTWGWLALPTSWVDAGGLSQTSFPLPVACLSAPVDGQTHLVSATAVWHLLPGKSTAGEFFRTGNADFWAFCEQLEVLQHQHLVPSTRGKSMRQAFGASDPPPGSVAGRFSFASYMASPHLLLCSLAWLARFERQAAAMQQSAFSIIKTIVHMAAPVPEVLTMRVCEAAGVKVFNGDELWAFLTDRGLGNAWRKAAKAASSVRVSELPALTTTVPVHELVWVLARSSHSDRVMPMLSAALCTLASGFALSLPARVSDELPMCQLPTVCQIPSLKKAMRGEDKLVLLMGGFLKRNWGMGAVEQLMVKEVAYADHFRRYRDHALHALSGAYFTAAREAHARACEARRTISGDFLMGDCSRVASQELLLLQLCSNGLYTVAPLKIIPDSGVAGATSVAESSGQLPGELTKRRKVRQGHVKTYWELLSYLHALLFMLPFKSMKPWLPDSAPLSGTVTRHTHRCTGHAFERDERTGKSRWCLPQGLRDGEWLHAIRALVLICDEGSEGWSFFQYLANGVKARVLFIRDPPHRLSNLFTNALRGDRTILASCAQVLIVHKFRRAPYGGGKFWKGLKEVLAVFLDHATDGHPLLQLLGDSIAEDYEVRGASADVRALAARMLAMPLGPKVQTRRWYTLYDAGIVLSRIWHTMLLALLIWYHAEGQDPEQILRTKTEARPADGDDSQNYEIRAQTLITLASSFHHRVLRSMLVCFERMWTQHKQYTANCYAPAATLNYLQSWADARQWEQDVVIPALHDCFFRRRAMLRVNLETELRGVAFPLLEYRCDDGGENDNAAGEDEHFLWIHVRMAMNMLAQMLLYTLLPRSPPWSFCLLLLPGKAAQQLAFLRQIWDLQCFLKSSHDPAHQALLSSLPFLDWTVMREVMELFVLAQWNLETPFGQRALAYVRALFEGGVLTTLGLENGFNDLRDNEARGARHQQRSAETLQSLSLSSHQSRYEGHAELVRVTPELVSRCGAYHCDKDLFAPEKLSATQDTLGFDIKSFYSNPGAKTKVDLFPRVQLSLLHALLAADRESWPNLWMACLLRPHMVVYNQDSQRGFYVVRADHYTVTLIELGGTWPDLLLSADSRVCDLHTVPSLSYFECYDATWDYLPASEGVSFRIGLDNVCSIAEYCARRWLHLLPVGKLRMLLKELGIPTKGLANQLQLATALLDHYGIDGGERQLMLSKIEALIKKRRRSKPRGGEEGQEDDDEDGGENDDVHIPEVLAKMAPDEVAFLVTGKVAAGSALNEEETDAGLDAQAAASGAPGPTTMRPPPVPSKAASSSASLHAASAIGSPPPSVADPSTASSHSALPLPASSSDGDVMGPKALADVERFARASAADVEFAVPPGCSLRAYQVPGKPAYWEARLPDGISFQATDSSVARNSRRRNWHAGLRSEQKAKSECLEWLWQAHEQGALGGRGVLSAV